MKRDMDLIREILLQVEAAADDGHGVSLKLPEHAPQEVLYHVRLLVDAGLLVGIPFRDDDQEDWVPTALTWKGHEFLDAARNERVWQRTKALVAEKGGSVSLSVLQALLTEAAKSIFRIE